MKILLRNLDIGSWHKEDVELATVPHAGEEIHWPDRILRVYKTMHFPQTGEPGEYAACLYVVIAT